MDSKDLQTSFFKRPVQLMNFLGINPYKPKTVALIILASFNAFSIFIGAATESTYSFKQFRRKDIVKGLDSFGPALVKTVTTLKILYLWNRSEVFINVIEECKEFFFEKNEITKDPRKQAVQSRMHSLATKFTILTFWLAMFTNISFCCRPWVIMLSNHLNGLEVEKLMPFNA